MPKLFRSFLVVGVLAALCCLLFGMRACSGATATLPDASTAVAEGTAAFSTSLPVKNAAGTHVTTAKVTVKGSYSQAEERAVVDSASCSFTTDPSAFSAEITTKDDYATVTVFYKSGVPLAKYQFTLSTDGTFAQTDL